MTNFQFSWTMILVLCTAADVYIKINYGQRTDLKWPINAWERAFDTMFWIAFAVCMYNMSTVNLRG